MAEKQSREMLSNIQVSNCNWPLSTMNTLKVKYATSLLNRSQTADIVDCLHVIALCKHTTFTLPNSLAMIILLLITGFLLRHLITCDHTYITWISCECHEKRWVSITRPPGLDREFERCCIFRPLFPTLKVILGRFSYHFSPFEFKSVYQVRKRDSHLSIW